MNEEAKQLAGKIVKFMEEHALLIVLMMFLLLLSVIMWVSIYQFNYAKDYPECRFSNDTIVCVKLSKLLEEKGE